MIPFTLRFPVLSWFLFSRLVSAALVNFTVDDSQEDLILYSPPGVWWSNGTGPSGTMPNSSLAYNGTWHFGPNTPAEHPGHVDDADATITFKFNGTAVNIFAILQREILTAVNISINGSAAGNYYSVPDFTSTFLYSVSLFSNASLPFGEHTLVLSSSPGDVSWICLDYVVYGQEDFSSNAKSLTPTGTTFDPTFPTPLPITMLETSSSDENVTPATTETSSPPPPISAKPAVSASLNIASSSMLSSSMPSSSMSVSSTSNPTISTIPFTSMSGTVIITATSPVARSAPASFRTLDIILGSTIGGTLFLCLLLIVFLCYRRARRNQVFRVDPFNTPDSSPNTQAEFMKSPRFATSSHSFLARLSFQTTVESAGSTHTLTDEIFPLPSEVDDVYNQLEALSAEVQRLQCSEGSQKKKRGSNRRIASPAIQAGVDQLRADVQRLRHRSGSPSSAVHDSGRGTRDTEPSTILRDLALLRAEIDELLVEQMVNNGSDNERLPSYHSRKAVHTPEPEDPPPLPQQPSGKSCE